MIPIWPFRTHRASCGSDGGRLLPVADNCREMGGYPLPNGRRTLAHRFLRSGTTTMLGDEGIDYLLAYGVRHVVDLRSIEEVRNDPDPLSHVEQVSYANIPLYGHNLHDRRLERVSRQDDYLTSGYLRILANRAAVGQVFSSFAAATDDECVLFHCSAGMDRTGVTAMLLLDLAGVEERYITADYLYSFGSRDEIDDYLCRGIEPRWAGVDTLRDIIERVRGRLLEAYGSTEEYLTSCGLAHEQLSRVKTQLRGAERPS